MNKQALYSAIMEKVAIQVKKAINEADSNVSETFMTDEEVMGLIDPELIITDDDGTTYINLDDLSVLPKEIILVIFLAVVFLAFLVDLLVVVLALALVLTGVVVSLSTSTV